MLKVETQCVNIHEHQKAMSYEVDDDLGLTLFDDRGEKLSFYSKRNWIRVIYDYQLKPFEVDLSPSDDTK